MQRCLVCRDHNYIIVFHSEGITDNFLAKPLRRRDACVEGPERLFRRGSASHGAEEEEEDKETESMSASMKIVDGG